MCIETCYFAFVFLDGANGFRSYSSRILEMVDNGYRAMGWGQRALKWDWEIE